MKKFVVHFLKICFLSILLFCPNSIFAQSNLQQGLQLYLPFSNSIVDASGQGNVVTNNGAIFTTDAAGNANSALQFDGINDFLEIISSTSLQCTDSISMCAKVYPTAFYAGACQSNVIIQKKDNDFGDGHYSLRFGDAPFDNNCSISSYSNETFYGHMKNLGAFPNGTSAGSAGAAPYINLNQWYCLVYTWDGNTIKMYVDGVVRFQYAYSNQSNGTSNDHLFIGKRNDAIYPYYFTGKLDEIRIYNRALKSNEVIDYCNNCHLIQSLTNFASAIDSSICKGESTILQSNASLPNQVLSYSWLPSTNLQNANLQYPTASPTVATTYTLTITDNNGCSNTATCFVQVIAKPLITVTNSDTICAGQTATVTAFGGISYTWAPSATLTTAVGPITQSSASVSTIYTVTGTDNNSCTNTATVLIGIAPPINVTIVGENSLCLEDSIQLIGYGGIAYTWTPLTGAQVISNNSIIVWTTIPTTYTITVKDENGCSAVKTYFVDVINRPIISLTKSNDLDCAHASANLMASGASSFTWQPSNALQNAVGASVLTTTKTSTTFTVTGTQGKCSNESTISVLYNAGAQNTWYVPNSITPNDDGNNDYFKVKTNQRVVNFKLIIVNRWGQKVFESADINKVWYGDIGNQTNNVTDVYFYSLEFENECEVVKKTGDILVMR
jgi:gliding motility-associated-like protein